MQATLAGLSPPEARVLVATAKGVCVLDVSLAHRRSRDSSAASEFTMNRAQVRRVMDAHGSVAFGQCWATARSRLARESGAHRDLEAASTWPLPRPASQPGR